MLRTLSIVTLLLSAAVAAGCIAPPEEKADAASVLPPPDAGGVMTARSPEDETRTQPCSALPVPLIEPGVYCATRVVAVGGDLTLTSLPAALVSSFGDVRVETAEPGTWGLEVTIAARGSSAQEARARTEPFEVTTDIGVPGAHQLDARVLATEKRTDASVDVLLRLPAATLYELTIETGSGDVDVGGVRTVSTIIETGSGDVETRRGFLATTLTIETGSGDIDGQADVTTLALATGSGDVTFAPKPKGAATTFSVSTGSGDVTLSLPQPGRAYDISATTGSGDIEYRLEGGKTTANGDHQARFVSDGYASAKQRTSGTITTGSGDVVVKKA